MMLKSVLNVDAQKVLNKIAPDALKVPQERVLGVQKHPRRCQKASPEAPERAFGGAFGHLWGCFWTKIRIRRKYSKFNEKLRVRIKNLNENESDQGIKRF